MGRPPWATRAKALQFQSQGSAHVCFRFSPVSWGLWSFPLCQAVLPPAGVEKGRHPEAGLWGAGGDGNYLGVGFFLLPVSSWLVDLPRHRERKVCRGEGEEKQMQAMFRWTRTCREEMG